MAGGRNNELTGHRSRVEWPRYPAPAGAEDGRPAKSARRVLASGKSVEPRDLRHLIEVASALDFSVLQPGRAATETIAQIASDLKLASQYQVRVRQTDNTGTLRNFVTAVLAVEPNATGPAVGLFEAGKTVVSSSSSGRPAAPRTENQSGPSDRAASPFRTLLRSVLNCHQIVTIRQNLCLRDTLLLTEWL